MSFVGLLGWANAEDFTELEGKTIDSIVQSRERVEINLVGGEGYVMEHMQDCCESVELIDVDGDLQRLVGQRIEKVECVQSGEELPIPEDRDIYLDDHLTWTFYKIRTNLDSVTLRWLGTSNGYYSEDVYLYKRENAPSTTGCPHRPTESRERIKTMDDELSFVNRQGETITYEVAGESSVETFEFGGDKYELVITPYSAKGYFGKRNAKLVRNGDVVAEFWRNYADFPFTFVQHPNGNLYFVCSEDYHGQVTMLNITTGERRSLHPKDGMEEPPKYAAWFMWIRIAWDAAEQVLNVFGGYWGVESEFGTRTFDFSRPDEVPYNQDWWQGLRTTEGEENSWQDEDEDGE